MSPRNIVGKGVADKFAKHAAQQAACTYDATKSFCWHEARAYRIRVRLSVIQRWHSAHSHGSGSHRSQGGEIVKPVLMHRQCKRPNHSYYREGSQAVNAGQLCYRGSRPSRPPSSTVEALLRKCASIVLGCQLFFGSLSLVHSLR